MSRLPKEPPGREITPEAIYLRRREFLKNAALLTGTSAAIGTSLLWLTRGAPPKKPVNATLPPPSPTGTPHGSGPLKVAVRGRYTVNEPRNSFAEITSYNNFYEFGTDKEDPAANAGTLRTRPWTVAVEGEVRKPQRIDIETLLRWFPLEERVYRMRCVEAWSMVIPWLGFPL
ncbi:MAG: mononuclear molybdenum enzyme YedY, partial [Chloroflexota bacterium]